MGWVSGSREDQGLLAPKILFDPRGISSCTSPGFLLLVCFANSGRHARGADENIPACSLHQRHAHHHLHQAPQSCCGHHLLSVILLDRILLLSVEWRRVHPRTLAEIDPRPALAEDPKTSSWRIGSFWSRMLQVDRTCVHLDLDALVHGLGAGSEHFHGYSLSAAVCSCLPRAALVVNHCQVKRRTCRHGQVGRDAPSQDLLLGSFFPAFSLPCECSRRVQEMLLLVFLGFMNAICEEGLSRGLFAYELRVAGMSSVQADLIQSLFFGVAHFHGTPSGFTGVFLTFGFGIIMSALKYQGGGLLLPILVHGLADVFIFLVVSRRSFDGSSRTEKEK
eukprot:757435-Hanusia_phi.AAC.1